MPVAAGQPASSGSTIPLSTPNVEVVQDDGYQANLKGLAGRTRQSSATSGTQPDTTKDGLEKLAGKAKRLIQGIQKLRHLGIEDFVLPLPKICVVGDQSTGKSSLIEGISEIKVPRKAGTCTRCPIEINLTESGGLDSPWICHVYLFKKYIFEGAIGAKATNRRPLGPWTLQDPEDHHFATVRTKEAVGEVLHWAQLATLNPGKHPDLYKAGTNSNTSDDLQVKFSPNCVRVEISGPGLPNLSFYDLPGIINDPENEDERYLVKLVRNLVKDYITVDNCINLLALPMTHDAANSSAAGIIKEVGAQARTVGVLTKPDRVQPGESLDQWVSILSGRKFKLGYGYHVVKNNPDPLVDHATARREEKHFFQTVEPYATQLADYESRFGILRLQEALSHKLTAQILSNLPNIKAKILEKATAVDSELAYLPKPPAGNLPLLIHSSIIEFSRNVQLHIDGGSPDMPFLKNWHQLALEFRKQLADSRPSLAMPSTAPRSCLAGSQANVFVDSTPGPQTAITIESDPDEPQAETPTQTRPAKKRSLDGGASTTSTSQKKARKITDIPQYMHRIPVAQAVSPAKKFTLPDIREIMDTAYVGLPGQIDPRVSERMSKMSMAHWQNLLTRFLDATLSMCEQLITIRIAEGFSISQQTPLYDTIVQACGAFLNRAMEEQRIAANRSLARELHKAMTLDEGGMINARNKALQDLRAHRLTNRLTALVNEQEAQTGKATSGQARKDKIAKMSASEIDPDPFDQEILAMATVRAYYVCAFSRFVDVVALGIQFELFEALKNDLRKNLILQLGLESPDANERCAMLLAVDPHIQARRQHLEKEQASLLEARQWLQSLTKDVSSSDGDDNGGML